MFKFITYLQPTWYFILKPGKDYGYFPITRQLTGTIAPDELFSPAASIMEMAYRANRTGNIDRKYRPGINWWEPADISLYDEYLFARKYFHTSRVAFVLLIRLLTFHNPLKELTAYRKSSIMKRVSIKSKNPLPDGYEIYPFNYQTTQPLVTIIIPTLNRYNYLANVLRDLEKQDYKNFEIIIVDQSEPFDELFYRNFSLNIKLIRQEEKALWLARNTAVKQATGKWLAFSEDDIRIPHDWLSNHFKCIEYFDADISNGIFFPAGQGVPEDRNFFRYADQFATGNAFMKKEVFLKTGLFDRQFEKQRMGDGEFGLRAYQCGFKALMNPIAWCEDVKAETGGLRESGNWDAFRPKSIWSPRPVPSVLYFYRKYFGSKAAILSLVANIPPSIIPYQYKRNRKLLAAGSVFALLLTPLILIQVARSWRKSTIMLQQSMINPLND